MTSQPGFEGADQREGVDDFRAGLHGMWAAVAAGWGEHAAFVDVRGRPVAQRMLELSAPRPGERVLELACGPGGVGLAAAELVAPGGEVVLSDVAAEMTSIAAARAAALGITNVSTCELDLERIDQPDSSYDVVLCREGLMLVPDPARAVREIRRVLGPGGRAALAVWGARARNPWLGALFDAVSAERGMPVPPPGIPGPFSLDDPGQLTALLADAGLTDVDVSELPLPLRASSFDDWWARVPALAGPLAQMIAALPEDAARAIRARAEEALGPYEEPDGLEIPGLTQVAFGRRAA